MGVSCLMKRSTSRNKLYTAASVAILLVIWEIAARAVGAGIIFPSPAETFQELVRIITSKNFLAAVVHTTSRSLAGFGIAFISAVIAAVLASFWKPLYYLLNPVIVITKATPTMSVILLALIWLDTERAPILIGLMVIFPIIYSSIIAGLDNVDEKLIQMSDMYKVSRPRLVGAVYFPSILPYVLAASSTAIGLNIKVVIAAEVLSQPRISIGTSLHMEKVFLNTGGVFAWTLVAILLSAAFDYGISLFKKRVERWR